MRAILAVLTLGLMLWASPALSQQPRINVQGTTNLTPLLTKEATAFESTHVNTPVAVAGTSSGAGIAALKSGDIDVAASDIAVSDPDFVDTALGTVGFAFIANPKSGIKNLNRAQAQAIFAGKVTNWKSVGGNDCPIVIIGRDIGTGTRLVLEEKVAKTLIPTKIARNADDVMAAVAANTCAIGYVATYFIGGHDNLVVAYNGTVPTPDTIKNHAYAFSTVEHLYVRKNSSAAARAFVSQVAGDAKLLNWYGIY